MIYEDAVVPWPREVAGRNPTRTNQRWGETSDGYIWSPYLQPVRNVPNIPIKAIPETGLWVEVSVPHVGLVLDNPPARSPGFQDRQKLGLPLRLYYTQIVWVDRVETDSQGRCGRINERYGSYGDILWGAVETFHPLTTDKISPISPEVEEKRGW